jgi:hypothetical protein
VVPWWNQKPTLVARLVLLAAIALYSDFIVISVTLRIIFSSHSGDYDPAVLWGTVAIIALCGATAGRAAVRTSRRLR